MQRKLFTLQELINLIYIGEILFQYLINVIVQFNNFINQSGMGLSISFSSLAIQTASIIGVWALAFYIFKSVGIYKMCKNNNIKHKYLAFVPFANYILIGKLTGSVRFFSLKFKNMGILTSILLFLMFGLNIASDYIIYYDEFVLLITQNIIPTSITHPNTLLVNLISALSDVSYFVTLFGIVWLNVGFVRKFNPKHFIWITLLLTFLFSGLFYIIYNAIFAIVIFTMRKNKPFNIEEYIRRQQELQRMAYEKANQRENGHSQYSQPQNDDPFDEFSSNSQTEAQKPFMEQDIFSDFTPDKYFTNENNKEKNNNDINEN